jgi:tRNA/rRNA methyltransferase
MNLNNVVVVLDRPEESRNIGAVCRAMANNSIHTLRIVAKKEDIDEERVRILSIHAFDIYQNAQFYDSITDAVKDCAFAAGTTRRKGKKRQGKLLLPEELTDFADRITGNGEEQDGQKLALVFGNERTGLEDDELNECNLAVTIPSSEEFGSLNLSHAVQIMCYHFFRSTCRQKTGYLPITRERLDKTVDTIADSLQDIGFFKVTGREDMENFWNNILSRAALSESEAQYIEKVFSKAAGLASKNQATTPADHQD